MPPPPPAAAEDDGEIKQSEGGGHHAKKFSQSVDRDGRSGRGGGTEDRCDDNARKPEMRWMELIRKTERASGFTKEKCGEITVFDILWRCRMKCTVH